jgi:hypothetical protein
VPLIIKKKDPYIEGALKKCPLELIIPLHLRGLPLRIKKTLTSKGLCPLELRIPLHLRGFLPLRIKNTLTSNLEGAKKSLLNLRIP